MHTIGGGVGQAPGNEKSRLSGAGIYAGYAVVLLALWAVLQSFRGVQSKLTEEERRSVWFWMGAAGVSLVLAWGRHAPFYQILYAMPYFSTIRNPIKFMNPFQISLLILCAHGLKGCWRAYVTEGVAAGGASGPWTHFKAWLGKAGAFERKWVYGSGAAMVAGFVGWLIYAESKPRLVKHFNQIMPLSYEGQAEQMARFSIGNVGWSVLFLVVSGVSVAWLLSGYFSGPRRRWAAPLLAGVVAVDLAHANAPWLVYYDYQSKYVASPVLEFLSKESPEHRVQVLPFQLPQPQFQFFQQQYYYVTWLQNLFQYFNIRSLDVIQEPRVSEDKVAYRAAFTGTPLQSMVRYWQLTNTRYHFGLGGDFAEQINQQLDPEKKRFRLHTSFDLAQDRPGGLVQAVAATNGALGLIEFTGALPRAALYTQWDTVTNEAEVLRRLMDPAFDPAASVLVSDPEVPASRALDQAAAAGKVSLKVHAPKRLVYQAKAEAPSVFLLNDRYAPEWKVWVNGKPEKLLRCNYIMRGVHLPPGEHEVEFRFEPGHTALYVSLGAIVLGVVLCGFLALGGEGRNFTAPLRENERS